MLKICLDLFKTCLKIFYFCQHIKKAKKGQMAKPFYFWQTVSKKAKFGRFGLLKGQMATLIRIVLVAIEKNTFSHTALLGLIHTRHFGTQYCDKKIKRYTI